MKNEYWQHRKSGEVYAVLVDYQDTGPVVKAACGPLEYTEINLDLLASPYFEFNTDPELAEDLEHRAEEYRAYTGGMYGPAEEPSA